MKFIKGMLIGTMVAAGVAMLYSDGMMDKKALKRKGRQIMRKMGV